MNNENAVLPLASDETVEIQLAPEEFQALNQAAEAARADESAHLTQVTQPAAVNAAGADEEEEDPQTERGHRVWRSSVQGIALLSCVTAANAALAWWGASHFGVRQNTPAPVIIRSAAAAVPQPVARAIPQQQPQPATVRVANPFDATEVFEFPAGTSSAEVNEKVSQLLLQRARDRESQWVGVKTKGRLHTGKNAQALTASAR